MQNKKILFRFGSKNQPITRFGEIDILSRSCYFRGIELGYKQRSIYFEWPLNIDYSLKCPQETILPIKFVEYDDINQQDYHKVINLTESNIFYEGSPPLYDIKKLIERNHIAFLNYLNKYCIDYKKRPIYHINKTNQKYILVHTRKLNYATTRNSDINDYGTILKLIKKNYKDYKIYRCGEIDVKEHEFNDLFDRYYSNLFGFNDFLNVMNNSNLFIGCSSGPIQYAYCFGKPIIEIGIPKTVNWSPIQEKYKGMEDYFSTTFWKQGLDGRYGDTIDHYIDKDTYLKLFAGDEIDIRKIVRFMKKWLI